jgi:Domain of unknown function (DUF4282)
MSVTIHCPHCGAAGNAPDHIIGQSVRCSKCKKQFVAGGEDAEASDEIPEEEEAGDDMGDMDDDAPPPRSKSRGGRSGGRSRSSDGGGSGPLDVVTFKALFGPPLIAVVYWVYAILSVIYGIYVIIQSFNFPFASLVVWGVIGGLGIIFVGVVVGRVIFESLAVLYRIHEVLKEKK